MLFGVIKITKMMKMSESCFCVNCNKQDGDFICVECNEKNIKTYENKFIKKNLIEKVDSVMKFLNHRLSKQKQEIIEDLKLPYTRKFLIEKWGKKA